MSTVHFIDTTVMSALLNIPHFNDKGRYEAAKEEHELLKENGDVFVLPMAVLVETGNHIAHIPDGRMRHEIADKFVALVSGAIKSENNWNIIPEIPIDVLETILSKFPDQATAATGFGDVSIVEQFNEYWEKKQPIGEMRIWSFDAHLQGYSRTGGLSRRKNK